MKKISLLLITSLFLLWGCKTSQNTSKAGSNNKSETAAKQNKEKPEPDWAPDKGSYNASNTRTFDLIHTKLDVRFDWDKTWLIGKAWLKLRPYFYSQRMLDLDAKGFEVIKIALKNGGQLKDLDYTYDGAMLHIDLGREYSKNEDIEIFIDYISKPNELEVEGSSAITDSRGLYFINPDGSDPKKPKQIWTQGETEASSCWFPTIDSPNERCTQEIDITVANNFATLSNGVLSNQKDNGDSTRTDTWQMNQPHAPYLFMMAVGEFGVTTEKWRGKDVMYYLESDYHPHADLIFGNTPEMLEFFSVRLGVEYPWDKFAQIVVRDFVSGAMENTTAVIHFDMVQHDPREHLDNPMEDIIAHELFHHWFGDLVTCESWSNLPLNESFATYGEYLWNEHKYGRDQAMMGLKMDLNVYLSEASRKREPLIRFHYRDKEDMFDAHSYQKGGRVLHLLRSEVGDDAFFASLKYYLEKNAYSAVEIDELRLAFEDVTGRDMNWFFNQYFHNPGHPEVDVLYKWNETDKAYEIKLSQTQDQRYSPIYDLPIKVGMRVGDKWQMFEARMNTQDTVFSIPMDARPEGVIFDYDKVLLADIEEEKRQADWLAQLKYGDNYVQKSEALGRLLPDLHDAKITDAVIQAAEDPFWGIRRNALAMLNAYSGEETDRILNLALRLANNDPKAAVRTSAISLIKGFGENATEAPVSGEGGTDPDRIKTVLTKALQDSSYSTTSQAIKAYYALFPAEALPEIKRLAKNAPAQISGAIADVYMDAGLPEAVDFTVARLKEMGSGMEKISLISVLANFLKDQEGEPLDAGIKGLIDISTSNDTWWIRFTAIQSLSSYSSRPDVKEMLLNLQETETNDYIIQTVKKILAEE